MVVGLLDFIVCRDSWKRVGSINYTCIILPIDCFSISFFMHLFIFPVAACPTGGLSPDRQSSIFLSATVVG